MCIANELEENKIIIGQIKHYSYSMHPGLEGGIDNDLKLRFDSLIFNNHKLLTFDKGSLIAALNLYFTHLGDGHFYYLPPNKIEANEYSLAIQNENIPKDISKDKLLITHHRLITHRSKIKGRRGYLPQNLTIKPIEISSFNVSGR